MFMAKIQVSSDHNPGSLLQEEDDTSEAYLILVTLGVQ